MGDEAVEALCEQRHRLLHYAGSRKGGVRPRGLPWGVRLKLQRSAVYFVSEEALPGRVESRDEQRGELRVRDTK